MLCQTVNYIYFLLSTNNKTKIMFLTISIDTLPSYILFFQFVNYRRRSELPSGYNFLVIVDISL